MSAVLMLTGLSWLSVRPKAKEAVKLDGVEVDFVHEGLSPEARREFEWAWDATRLAGGATSLVSEAHGSQEDGSSL